MNEQLKIAIKVAWKFVGTFYRWGGDDPGGFDCSGLVIEILKSVGLVPRNYDGTAQKLFELFKNNQVIDPESGCLVFWSDSSGKIIHVEFCINEMQTIGASGGNSTTLTREDAEKQNAYVKVRPIREGYSKLVNPFL